MNPALPIYEFRDQISDSVKNNIATIISARTGAGKSSQVPQILLNDGYDIVVTQPRRLAASSLAVRVSEEIGEPLGMTVGYRTAYEHDDSPMTRCLYCTDGLALVRELMGSGKHNVLIIDEVHEWNMNIETLLSWSLYHIKNRPIFRVVLMSATMEAQKLSDYFLNAPIIEVPGRMFPIEERKPKHNFIGDIKNLIEQKRNILVFQPGKNEIQKTINALEEEDVDAVILPLHGDLKLEEQKLCFQSYSKPKVIVSTNVAQTSITIDDIDAVVDSGMERRIELVDGVEGLYLRPISQSDSEQRKGRSGRVKPGIYIDYCPAKDRPKFPKPEILRTRLDQTVLRLAEAGFDAEKLPFFHQPKISAIRDAKKTLRILGCFDKEDNVTKLGQDIALMPISVRFARMVIEADKRGVVEDVVTIAALMEAGEITQRKNLAWRSLIRREKQSDVFSQLAIFTAANGMSEEERELYGIHEKTYQRVIEIRDHLSNVVKTRVSKFSSSGNRPDILKSVLSGMVDCLYRCDFDDGKYINTGGLDRTEDEDDCYDDARILSNDSVIKEGKWLVALPFDLHIDGRYGESVLHLLRMATVVDPHSVIEFAPHLLEKRTGELEYDIETDECYSVTRLFFNGLELPEQRNAVHDPVEASYVFANWLAKEMLIRQSFIEDKQFRILIKAARGNVKAVRKKTNNADVDCLNVEGLTKIMQARLNGIFSRHDAMNNSQVFYASLFDTLDNGVEVK